MATTSDIEVPLSIGIACEDCERPAAHGTIMLEMEPRPGSGVPVYLCVRCWFDDGGFSGKPSRPERVIEPGPELQAVVTPPVTAATGKTKTPKARRPRS